MADVVLSITIPDAYVARVAEMLEKFGDYSAEWAAHLAANPGATQKQLAKAAIKGVLTKDLKRYEDLVDKDAINNAEEDSAVT